MDTQKSIVKPAFAYFKDLDDTLKQRGSAPELPIQSLNDLNRKLWGFKKKQLYVVGSYTSHGKCLGGGTPVLMFSGETKKVEDIRVCDLLMGIDGKPRKVLETTNGVGQLYKVTQLSGEDYVVNENHVLSLKSTGVVDHKNQYSKGNIVNISVKDYIKSSGIFKHRHKGYFVGVEFPKADILIDPYLLGIWLGDGTSTKPEITTADREIVDFITNWAKQHNLQITVGGKYRYNITNGRRGHGVRNGLLNDLRSYGILGKGKKRIPKQYLINNRKIRLSLLAGLLDSDGNVNKPSSMDFSNANYDLIKDVRFLCKSLGYKAKSYEKMVNNKIYYRLSISANDYSEIPFLLKRKIPKNPTREATTGAIKIHHIGIGEYFGFELDGDKMFLLGDFTVTHNSSFCLQLAMDWVKQDFSAIYLSLEMPIVRCLERMLCQKYKITNTDLLTGKRDQYANDLKAFEQDLKKWRLVITDCIGFTWQEVDDLISRLKTKPDVIILDYAQITKRSGKMQKDTYDEYIKHFREMAIRHNFCAIIVSQIGRASREDSSKEPQLHHLQGTSLFEIHADCVILLKWKYRDTNKLIDFNKYTLFISKNRDGATGYCELYFKPENYLFEDAKPKDWNEEEQ